MERLDRERPENYFDDWKEREALAEGLIPIVGRLYREKNIKSYLYGYSLHNESVLSIMQAHRKVRQVEENELSEFETYPIAQALAQMDLGPAHVDLGRLAVQYEQACEQRPSLTIEQYLHDELADLIGAELKQNKPVDVVLYGFGRIGRLMARLLIEKTGGGSNLRLKAIVVRPTSVANDLEKRASLLRRDSVHGRFKGTIRVDHEHQSFVANGNEVRVIYASTPEEIDYTSFGIKDAIVVDNTGIFRDDEALKKHLQSKGARKVILTAPGKGSLKNIVFGVNHDLITADDVMISAASCTTNAIVPPLQVIDDAYGIVCGHVETVHSYTNDQNLIDNYHKADRRGRSAALNMVITETGAAKAVSKVLPQLSNKLTGNAIRVPTPNVSLAILNLTLSKNVSLDDFNAFMKQVALHSPLRKQLDYSNSPEVVSTDFVGTRCASTYDAEATIVNGNHIVVYLWYDNEFGYSCQVHRILEQMAGVKYAVYPKN